MGLAELTTNEVVMTGYWERMSMAEGKLLDYYLQNRETRMGIQCLCKSWELSDKRFEYMNPGVYERYVG